MAKVNTSAGVASFALLGQVYRPTAVVHVGAGYGRGWLHQWRNWGVPAAWLIDADASKLGWVNKLSGGGPSDGSTDDLTTAPNAESTVYHSVAAVVGQESGDGLFFQANNPEESALVSPEELRGVWPNLRAVSKQTQHIRTLDELVAVPAGAWLVVDCLPALVVLKGAAQVLDNAQVVVARVLLDGKAGGDSAVTDIAIGSVDLASAKSVIDFLTGFGLTVVDEVLGHHPGVGHLVFARPYSVVDRKALLASLEQEKREKDKLVVDLNHKVQVVTAERDTATQDKVTILKHKDDLQKKLGEVQAELFELSKEKEDVLAQRDALAKKKAALVAEKEMVEQEKSAALKKSQEQVTHIEKLAAEIASLKQSVEAANPPLSQKLSPAVNLVH